MPPILLWRPFLFAWLWWRQELWERDLEYVLLEVIPMAETIEPVSAMEQALSGLWGVYSSIEGIKHFRKKWIWGRKLYHFCIEIISIGDRPHIFLRILKEHEDSVKAAFFGPYPAIEINRAKDDYTRYISHNVPNSDWNLYGLDEKLMRPDIYPIKTYKMFFEERPEMIREEKKRIDPIATLLEGMSMLHHTKEQLWVQLRITPVSSKDHDYMKVGKKLVNKLVFRAQQESKSSKPGEKGFIPPEMKLTPRERDVVKAIEEKISKPAYETNIRVLYFGRPDIFKAGRRSLAENYFNSFATRDMNGFNKWSKTKTRIYHCMVGRRLYMRQRNIFWRYMMREIPLYPRKGGTFILNNEELATIFHPPVTVRAVGTFLPRINARTGEAPVELPTEEDEKDDGPKLYEPSSEPSGPIRSRKGEEPPELAETPFEQSQEQLEEESSQTE